MKFIIVGFGNQGKKRKKILKNDCVGIIDKKKSKSVNYTKIEDVPLNYFDAVILCTPDHEKIKIINYCIKNKKHVLIEKPLISKNSSELKILERNAVKKKVFLMTAYNHRYEKSLILLKNNLKAGKIGKIYNCHFKYLNGTAKNVFNTWRDINNKKGVISDLAPHLIDLIFFLFGEKKISKLNFCLKKNYENKSKDYCLFSLTFENIVIQVEVSYCNWKNTFICDVNGKKGSLNVSSLVKWGISKMIFSKRVLPSGKPIEKKYIFKKPDNSWKEEITSFKKNILENKKTNLKRDYYINELIHKL